VDKKKIRSFAEKNRELKKRGGQKERTLKNLSAGKRKKTGEIGRTGHGETTWVLKV